MIRINGFSLCCKLRKVFQVHMGRPVAIASCVLFGAAIMATAKNTKTVPIGTWAGEHVFVEVSNKGAELEFDCARGQVSQPIPLDKHGNFGVLGTFTPEHGGPVLRDEKVSAAQARYSGHIHGDVMSLT